MKDSALNRKLAELRNIRLEVVRLLMDQEQWAEAGAMLDEIEKSRPAHRMVRFSPDGPKIKYRNPYDMEGWREFDGVRWELADRLTELPKPPHGGHARQMKPAADQGGDKVAKPADVAGSEEGVGESFYERHKHGLIRTTASPRIVAQAVQDMHYRVKGDAGAKSDPSFHQGGRGWSIASAETAPDLQRVVTSFDVGQRQITLEMLCMSHGETYVFFEGHPEDVEKCSTYLAEALDTLRVRQEVDGRR